MCENSFSSVILCHLCIRLGQGYAYHFIVYQPLLDDTVLVEKYQVKFQLTEANHLK